jgi:hypothetical protein
MRGLKLVCATAAVSAILASGIAGAQPVNKRTYLTFSGPVSLPGITLPAGTYTFQIANPDTSSRVIQVMDKDQKNQRGLFFAIPTELREPPNDPVVRFAERPEGAPQAIKAWYYPGERTGFEFVYPRSQAVKIAKANHEKVLSYPDPAPRQTANANPVEEFKNAKVERVDENNQLTEVPRSVPAASNNPPQQSSSNAAVAENRRLPQTASPLALYELLSGISLAVGFGLRRRNR